MILFPQENRTGKCLLALDLGSQLGWALARRDGSMQSGLIHINAAAEAFKGRRWLEFRAILERLNREAAVLSPLAGNIDVITFERGSFFKSIAAGADYFGLVATLQLWAWERKVAIKPASTSSVKKHCAGHGRSQKVDVIDAVRAAGFSPGGPDEADAIALRDFALAQLNQGAREVA